MTACERCSEFKAENNSFCPICNLRMVIKWHMMEMARPILNVVTKIFGGQITGDYLTIEQGIEEIQSMLSIGNAFLKLEIPNKAITVEGGKSEDITPMALSLLRKKWESISYELQDLCAMLIRSLPEIASFQAYSDLFMLGFKQIGRSYQSEYMVSVQSFFRFPIYKKVSVSCLEL